jgi:hypothetical protein
MAVFESPDAVPLFQYGMIMDRMKISMEQKI